MGEEIGVRVVAGGEVGRSAWRRLLAEVEEGGDAFDGIAGDGTVYFEGTANFGNTESMRAALVKAGLAHLASSDAKYDVDAEVNAWFPGMDATASAPGDQSGNAMLKVDDLIEAHAKGPEALAALVEGRRPFSRVVPPLTIDGVRAVDADLGDVGGDGARAA